MPKRRGIVVASPESVLKKSRKPVTKRSSSENGVQNDNMSPEEEAEMIVETASTSSGENVNAADQISDDEEMEGGTKSKVENGVAKDDAKAPVDWLGLASVQQDFFETFRLCDPSKDTEVKQIVENCKEIFRKRLKSEDPSEKRQIVDQTVKDYFLNELIRFPDRWTGFLDLIITFAREEICSPTAVIALLTDLVEVSPLENCSQVFDYVESRLHIWKEAMFYVSGKNAVLRMCNDLLRRQSRAQNTGFCGRILIFLANFFPFSERSGVNIMSEFNTENVTVYKTSDGTDDPDDQMEVSEDSDEKLFEGMDLAIPGLDKIVSLTQEEKKRKIKVDYNLYVKFWSLQEFFRKPHDCYNKVSWKTFSMYIHDVLGAFHSFKLEESSHRKRRERSDDEKDLRPVSTIPKLGDENLYFAKYLTNRRLLELQMSDPTFRRYFLVQLIIILQYLTVPVKFKSETQCLSEDQLDFVKKTSEKIYELLSEIPPSGPEFVICVKHILKREELWNKWKNDGCHAFQKPTPSPSLPSTNPEDAAAPSSKSDDLSSSASSDPKDRKKKKARRRIGASIKDASDKNKCLLGHTELTRLWNICADNLEACRMKVRDFMPQLEDFFQEAIKEMESSPTPMSVLVDAAKKDIVPRKILGDVTFGWKALRLLARRSPYFFQMFGGAPISPLQHYLEYVLKKINAEKDAPQNSQDDTTPGNRKGNETKVKPSDTPTNHDPEAGDNDQVMEAGTADDDELLRTDDKEASESGDEEEGEVNDRLVRQLTEEEQKAVAKALGDNWKKLALKLGFKSDEVEFFAESHKESASFHMLKNWTDQDDDSTAADLIYQLEGLKLKDLVADIFKL